MATIRSSRCFAQRWGRGGLATRLAGASGSEYTISLSLSIENTVLRVVVRRRGRSGILLEITISCRRSKCDNEIFLYVEVVPECGRHSQICATNQPLHQDQQEPPFPPPSSTINKNPIIGVSSPSMRLWLLSRRSLSTLAPPFSLSSSSAGWILIG